MHFHGGGMITFNAETTKQFPSMLALNGGDMVAFSVDFTSAPEARCPEFILECYAGTKYVIENAAKFNIDPKRVAI